MLLTVQQAVIVADAVSLVLCVACAVSDLRSLRIPNALSFGGAALGLAIAAASGSLGLLLSALAGLAFGLCASLPAGALGALGWGDVKLLAAVGALLRFPLALSAFVYTLLWGGLLALAIALRRGVLGQSLRNLRALPSDARARVSLHRMPYGLAILAGTAHAVASRYLPGCALW